VAGVGAKTSSHGTSARESTAGTAAGRGSEFRGAAEAQSRQTVERAASTSGSSKGAEDVSTRVGGEATKAAGASGVSLATRGEADARSIGGAVGVTAAGAVAEVDAKRPELVVEKSVDKERALPGETITYRISVRNVGPLAINAVEVTDHLPPHLEYIRSAGARPIKGGKNGTRRFALAGPLPPGAARVFTIVTRLKRTIPSGESVARRDGNDQADGT
jgi:uncharacterized repeat protein (TIGR01451 family)